MFFDGNLEVPVVGEILGEFLPWRNFRSKKTAKDQQK